MGLVTAIGALILLAAAPASAQTLTTLVSFNGSNGQYPFAGLTLSGNTLYGTTMEGGANGYGTVFSLTIGGGSPTVLASFNDSNGSGPEGGLTLSSDGNTLYGTTSFGGASNDGTVFSLPLGGGSPTVLASFNGSNGKCPDTSLTLSGNTLYGTTFYGGANGDGTVFSVPLGGGSPTTLLSFNSRNGYGYNPNGSLTLSGNILYGTTYQGGGASNEGTVFSLPLGGGSPTVLASFNGSNASNARFPYGGLTLSGNTLYGTTNTGGTNNEGTVFSLPLGGGSATVLASFNGSVGNCPQAGLTLSGNILYGTTYQGGASNDGTVFSLPLGGGSPTVLASFSGSNGQYPEAGLTLSGNILYGTTYQGGTNNEGTVFALNLAPATIALSNASNATIISGGTATLGMTVSNSPSSGYNLNYTLSAAVQSGSATLGAVTPATDSLAPGANDSCTVPATSTNLGVNMVSFTASDPTSSNLSQTTTATLTVLDHSNASLSSTATQTSQTINFGNVLRGAGILSKSFTICNLAANTTAAYTANLQLTGFSTSGDTALTTNLSAFRNLAASSSGNTFTASLDTSSYTLTGTKTITMAASQLADDSNLPGSGNNNNGGMTITLEGNVGNATADKTNSRSSFGTALTALVGTNTSYANLESKAMATTGSGGYDLVGSTATILAGANSSGSLQTVSMQWRTQTLAERTSPVLISDVLRLGGMSLDGTGQTSPFVLQMTYNPVLLPGGAGNEGLWASNEWLYLGWLNPSDGQWENAIDGNFGTNVGIFRPGAWPSGDMTLGDWGVNTANDTVWAVLNHNSDFAVVPEPSTLVLLGVAIGLVGYAWRWRRQGHSASDAGEPSVSSENVPASQEDGPTILAMPSRWTEATRRAA